MSSSEPKPDLLKRGWSRNLWHQIVCDDEDGKGKIAIRDLGPGHVPGLVVRYWRRNKLGDYMPRKGVVRPLILAKPDIPSSV